MTTTHPPELDIQSRAEAFGEQIVGILNHGALALMISIGHRTGLFDTMAGLTPATSQEIATAAGLQERYVREWLGAMVTGGIVTYDAEAATFRLPPEHAGFLTRAAGTDNLAVTMQFLALLASVEDEVAERFRSGGGVPYAAYGEFHRLMAEESSLVHDAALVGAILPLVPGLPGRLEAGIDVADVGCGSGHAVNLMAQAYPASRFTGYDFSEEGVAAGRAEAERLGLTNATFELRDVTDLGLDDVHDFITAFDAIHDQARPAGVLAGICRALRPGGAFLMVDIRASSRLENNVEHPLGPFLYTISTMHCMTVSLALDGDGLGTVWGRELATRMLRDAGFASIEVKAVEGDVFNDYFVCHTS
jgi:SAM-dependent methyltransferase